MNVLITAGNVQAPIDRVRCVTTGFTGRTGAAVARTAWGRGHTVTLVTSRPDALLEYGITPRSPGERFAVVPFRTYDELAVVLRGQLRDTRYDAVLYAAAGGDYLPAGTYTPQSGTFFNARTGEWEAQSGPPSLSEVRAGKVPPSEPEIWLRLVRGPRLLDRIRRPWGFDGILVGFQMEVGLGDTELVAAAEATRTRCGADLMAATTWEAAAHTQFLGPVGDYYERVPRREFPDRLLAAIEELHRRRAGHG